MATSKLIEAIRAGQLSAVIHALDNGADIEEADMHGKRGLPLRTACFEGYFSIAAALLERGADPNTEASDGFSAPLRLAQRSDHREIIALLLKHGAQIPGDISIPSAVAETPPPPVAAIPDYMPDNILDFDASASTPSATNLDGIGPFGQDTKVLSVDLLLLDEDEGDPLPALSPHRTR